MRDASSSARNDGRIGADNLLYFTVADSVSGVPGIGEEKVVPLLVAGRRNRTVRKWPAALRSDFSSRDSVELSVYGDLLLRRNLLVFCPYNILALRWRTEMTRSYVVLFVLFIMEASTLFPSRIQAAGEKRTGLGEIQEKHGHVRERVFFFLYKRSRACEHSRSPGRIELKCAERDKISRENCAFRVYLRRFDTWHSVVQCIADGTAKSITMYNYLINLQQFTSKIETSLLTT